MCSPKQKASDKSLSEHACFGGFFLSQKGRKKYPITGQTSIWAVEIKTQTCCGKLFKYSKTGHKI